MRDPLQALREVLATGGSAVLGGSFLQPDLERDLRTGVPEVILAEGKPVAAVADLVRQFLERRGRAIVSRVRPPVARGLQREFAHERVEAYPRARVLVIRRPDFAVPRTGGRVGIIAAGASDAGCAEEARLIAEEMGCETWVVGDVGVAGLHRLMPPLQGIREHRVDALVVVAGMDGALPSVVAGLVDVPVIGLPTSRGYGLGGKGVAALLSMLQTCVPGLTVVNVDNGIGAGAAAARIANRVAAERLPDPLAERR